MYVYSAGAKAVEKAVEGLRDSARELEVYLQYMYT